jgi:N-acetylmuramoyl-L-alanine amidase
LNYGRRLLPAVLSLAVVWLPVGAAGAGERIAVHSLETIVVDPGHGGQDRGVKGFSGLQEKDLCLALAQQLAQVLSQRLGVRVILTRNGDYSVSPYERAAVANHQRADLFVSLHFNADFSGRRRGMEIYVLEPSQVGDRGMNIDSPAGATRWHQAQLESLEQSRQLAQAIYQQAMDSPYINSVHLRSAPLLMLEGAAMPAVMVELAYLSHHQAEEKLWRQEYKTGLVEVLYQGILSYKRGLDMGSQSGFWSAKD